MSAKKVWSVIIRQDFCNCQTIPFKANFPFCCIHIKSLMMTDCWCSSQIKTLPCCAIRWNLMNWHQNNNSFSDTCWTVLACNYVTKKQFFSNHLMLQGFDLQSMTIQKCFKRRPQLQANLCFVLKNLTFCKSYFIWKPFVWELQKWQKYLYALTQWKIMGN